MRRFLILLITLSLIPSVPILVSEESDGSILDPDLVMVCPYSPEGMTIRNNDIRAIDLHGWTISDGEGEVTFTETFVLGPGKERSIFADVPLEWMHITDYTLIGDEGVVSDKFSLNDNGDDIHLVSPDGRVVDEFSYGDNRDVMVFPKITRGHLAIRDPTPGFNRGENWIMHVPGSTMYTQMRTYGDCSVIPFTFPESDGEEILFQIQDSNERIRISMYTFDNERIASALAHALDRGVRVEMLMEGSPAGGIGSGEVKVLNALWRLGADIRMMVSEDSYKRYQYLHNKYAVIDDDVTIITSENWSDSAFEDNRGWGACILDQDCASYISEIFDKDFRDEGDLIGFHDKFPTALPHVLERYVPVEGTYTTFTADVSPVLCPDYSRESLKDLVLSANTRVYSQQLNVQYSWVQEDDNPLQWMRDLGSKGVDARLLLDVTYDSPNDDDYKDGYGIFVHFMDDPHIQVRYDVSKRYGQMHNKGIIVDDTTWIGSMNWTDNSIDSNRELSVMIASEEVTGFFTERFLSDWGSDFDGTVDIVIDRTTVDAGKKVRLDASGSALPFGSVLYWDMDGDGSNDHTGTYIDWKFEEDTTILLTVIDQDGNIYERSFRILIAQEEGDGDREVVTEEDHLLSGPMKYVPLIALVTGILFLRRMRSG